MTTAAADGFVLFGFVVVVPILAGLLVLVDVTAVPHIVGVAIASPVLAVVVAVLVGVAIRTLGPASAFGSRASLSVLEATARLLTAPVALVVGVRPAAHLAVGLVGVPPLGTARRTLLAVPLAISLASAAVVGVLPSSGVLLSSLAAFLPRRLAPLTDLVLLGVAPPILLVVVALLRL